MRKQCRLREVPGIGKKRIAKIRENWERQKEIKNIMLFLQSQDISSAFAAKICREYGNDSIGIVKENPFRLADDIWGIGFKTADTIAGKLGFDKNGYARCRSGLMYTLNELAGDGHVYADREQLLKKAVALLDVEEGAIAEALDAMLLEQDLITDDEAIYLPPFY